ncbi:MAG: type II toxin-antitoxin system RelE family toxin, partial [Gammaproteobacteria bacterium]
NISNSARKKLRSLARDERNRIAEKIYRLGLNPDDEQLDVKLLEGCPGFYRLRVGDWRVIFTRYYEIKLVVIEKIKSRGDAYK